jgi:hypothetical protein
MADGTERDGDRPTTSSVDEHPAGPLPISEVARLTGLTPTPCGPGSGGTA